VSTSRHCATTSAEGCCEPTRRESGYRIYGCEAVRIVRFIKRAQELGFSLEEVEALLQLADGGP
jgi:DNA-binding transcriptional MerR regulator